MKQKFFYLLTLLILGWGTNVLAYSGGSGTEGDPYQIATKADLLALSTTPGDWGKHFIQTADIAFDAADFQNGGAFHDGGKGFSPIGSEDDNFTGTYNGGDHSIDGLSINRPSASFVGLFGWVSGSSAKIDRLGVTNVDVKGSEYVGGLVGGSKAAATIDKCYVTGSISSTNGHVGGLAGLNEGGTVSECYMTGSVSSTTDFVGGLVGFNGDSGTISGCYATSNISGTNYIGGLVGANVVGTISGSYAAGSASGTLAIGGLVGGFVNSTVTKCYATGSVSGPNYVGGFIGYSEGSTMEHSFWNSDTTVAGVGASPDNLSGATGKTTAELKTQATFTGAAGWDFTTPVWQIESGKNSGYPYLAWQTFDGSAGQEITIPATDTDPYNFPGAGITIEFQDGNANSVDLTLLVTRTDQTPDGSLPGAVQNISPRYWTVTVIGGSVDGSYDITLDLNGVPGIFNCPTLYVLKRENSGDPWQDVVADLGATIDRTNCPNSITIRGLTAFSEFALGGEEDNPLPVELTNFTGVSTNAGVRLNWKTASEAGNAGFVLYRNGIKLVSYKNVDALKGQGTSASETNYRFVDSDVALGESYTYKLTSVDHSGAIHEYTQTVSVEITEAVSGQPEAVVAEYALEQNYPNPFNPTTTIRYSLKSAGMATLKVFDMMGREILSEQLTGKTGWNSYRFKGNKLASGVYYYRISSGSFTETRKMMLLK